MRLMILLIVALAGCGVPPEMAMQLEDSMHASNDNNNHGYGWAFDSQTADGMRLRYQPFSDPSAQLNKERLEVQACAGLEAPPPFVIVLDQVGVGGGYYFTAPSLILIGETPASFKHEMVHYLLDISTGDLDPDHRSELFQRCGPPVLDFIFTLQSGR